MDTRLTWGKNVNFDIASGYDIKAKQAPPLTQDAKQTCRIENLKTNDSCEWQELNEEEYVQM